jgi:hypothetical protein
MLQVLGEVVQLIAAPLAGMSPLRSLARRRSARWHDAAPLAGTTPPRRRTRSRGVREQIASRTVVGEATWTNRSSDQRKAAMVAVGDT